MNSLKGRTGNATHLCLTNILEFSSDVRPIPSVTESPMRRQFLSVVDGASGTPRPQHAPRGEQQSLSANAAGSHEALTQLEHIVEFISWQHVAQTLHATCGCGSVLDQFGMEVEHWLGV